VGPNTLSVVFTANGTKIGTGTAKNNYEFIWTVPSGGTYAIVATAKDTFGNVTTATSTITATQDVPPVVTLTWPTPGLSYTGPTNLGLIASATSSYGPTSIVFYNGSTKLGDGPDYGWNKVQPGVYSITAVATDIYGVTGTSTPVTLTITPDVAPTITISSPADGSVFPAGSTITFQSNANSTTGVVESVTYYNGATKIKASNYIIPYQINWTKVPAGTYTITGVAADNYGLSTTSSPITITVTP